MKETTGHAFGLRLTSEFGLAGLDGSISENLPSCRLTLVDEHDLGRLWPQTGGRRIEEERDRRGAVDRFVDQHPDVGYRLFARYFGEVIIEGDGATIHCCPPPVASWRWQRLLVGRAIPMAAVLRGYEVLHASAVAVHGEVIAISGPSGCGKTSLALQLHLSGAASFVSDDVLVLEAVGSALVVHPGIGVTNVRLAEEARMGSHAEELGAVLGRSGRQKSHYAIRRETRPLPLGLMYFLSAGAVAGIEAVDPIPPDLLLGSSFVHAMRSPASLLGLLDTCHALSRSTPIFWLHRGCTAPDELARLILEHVSTIAVDRSR